MSAAKSIFACVEGDPDADEDEYPLGRPSDVRPRRLFRDGGFDPLGGTVLEVSTSLGTYGMGGTGFLGLQVAGGQPAEPRWIVVTLWAAASWATLDGDLVREEYPEPVPDRETRSLEACVTGATVIAATCTDDLLVLEFTRDGAHHRLEIRRDGRDVPVWPGTGQPRALGPDESMRDAVVVSESGYLWTADDDEGEVDEDE
ncbi:hypothetical protein [Nannocystis sp. SCPEA4]|uniref:hypothetical protein n=1 Tax=Nannocystis sp. SCPEA4 TaxID=2996787 RepID=UPI00226E674C|nr:hypothetical protein [Nannocystis sp. SCPEA4]MCY1055810.1 hypothetical protein [Nannocystis sp. SCPEA4]